MERARERESDERGKRSHDDDSSYSSKIKSRFARLWRQSCLVCEKRVMDYLPAPLAPRASFCGDPGFRFDGMEWR